jgi:hypothetical protein
MAMMAITTKSSISVNAEGLVLALEFIMVLAPSFKLEHYFRRAEFPFVASGAA